MELKDKLLMQVEPVTFATVQIVEYILHTYNSYKRLTLDLLENAQTFADMILTLILIDIRFRL